VFRSKRRKHSADVDSVVSLLTKVSSLTVTQSTSHNVAQPTSEMNTELSDDVVTKLHEMLAMPHVRATRLFDDVSTLNFTIQVGFFCLHTFCLLLLCSLHCLYLIAVFLACRCLIAVISALT